MTDGSETSSDVEDLTEPFALDDDFHVPESKVQQQQRFLSKRIIILLIEKLLPIASNTILIDA